MYLLFDIGGTKTRITISKNSRTLGKPKIIPTPKNFNEGMISIEKEIYRLAKGEEIKAAAGGITGVLDSNKSKLTNSTNLPRWVRQPIKEKIEKITNSPVYIENDAAIVGLGEANYGAGMGYQIVAYITISTGVGGTRIVDGSIDDNCFGFEPGHQVIDPNGVICPVCKVKGHLDGYVSGAALEMRFGKKAHEINNPQIWDETAKWLSIGLYNTILHWSPQVVILGGSMMKSISISKVREYLSNQEKIFLKLPLIKKAKLADFGGLWGTLAYVKQRLSNSKKV